MMTPRLISALAMATAVFAASTDLSLDRVRTDNVQGENNANSGWADSYSVGDRCFCQTTYDHNIGGVVVDLGGTLGSKTVRDICELLGPGPGSSGRPIYNDIQCGNGPPNDAGDEDPDRCPGRVDNGKAGCGTIGPKWKFDDQPPPAPIPVAPPTPSPVASPTSCGPLNYQSECSTTSGCQQIYNGATDCKNGEGGVCYCGSSICGCLGSPNPPAPSPPVPTPDPPVPAPIVPPTVVSPTSCGALNYQGECSATGGCQQIYNGATDCKNTEGGVCYCGPSVCGCSVPPVSPPAPPVSAPAPLPVPPPVPESCGPLDHQSECTTTGGCQQIYNGATDCKNSEGGVCYCGSSVCGCP